MYGNKPMLFMYLKVFLESYLHKYQDSIGAGKRIFHHGVECLTRQPS